METTVSVVAAGAGQLVLLQRPASRVPLRALAVDAFEAGNQPVTFKRDAAGRVTELHLASSRAYDVVFRRK